MNQLWVLYRCVVYESVVGTLRCVVYESVVGTMNMCCL